MRLQKEPGNIDLLNRPEVPNPEGGISTVLSMGVGEDGGIEVLIPRVVGERILSPEDAIAHYVKSGEHLGKYGSIPAADAAAQQIHIEQEALGKFLRQRMGRQ
jgi:hypothetical protein